MKTWFTMFQTPDENELVLIAVPPDIIQLAVWRNGCFENAAGVVKFKADEVAYWKSLTNPWTEEE